jgi:Putative Flp pilus-assembly TadE/G-like
MRVRTLHLGREDGQALVMSVLFLFGIVLLLALVVNVGLWYASSRRAQAVADSVALSVAPQVASSGSCGTAAGAQSYADANWQGTAVTSVTCPPQANGAVTVAVGVSHSVPGFFSGLLAAFGGVTVAAQATATVQAPSTLDNASLQTIAQTPTDVVPIVVAASTCGTQWTATCLQGVPQAPLVYRRDQNNNIVPGNINFLDLSCATAAGCQVPPPTADQLASWIDCAPDPDPAASTCFPAGAIGIGADIPPVAQNIVQSCDQQTGSCPVLDALQAIIGKTVIVAVGCQSVPGQPVPCPGGTSNLFHVVGFAAMTILGPLPTDQQWSSPTPTLQDGDPLAIRVQFQSFTPAPTIDASGGAPDYGLQTIGLTG